MLLEGRKKERKLIANYVENWNLWTVSWVSLQPTYVQSFLIFGYQIYFSHFFVLSNGMVIGHTKFYNLKKINSRVIMNFKLWKPLKEDQTVTTFNNNQIVSKMYRTYLLINVPSELLFEKKEDWILEFNLKKGDKWTLVDSGADLKDSAERERTRRSNQARKANKV